MITRYFEKAQRAITPFHPAWQQAPGDHVPMATKVSFTCNLCGATQRIALRRTHFFERFMN